MQLENSEDNNNSVNNYKGPSIYTRNNIIDKKKYTSSDDIEKILNDEQNVLKEESWSRLQNKEKINKINIFSNKYCIENNISEKEDELKIFLNDIFKKRTKKEVTYNKKEGIIESINGLTYNKNENKFQIIKQTNRISTLKGLPKTGFSRKKKDRKNITKKNNDIN